MTCGARSWDRFGAGRAALCATGSETPRGCLVQVHSLELALAGAGCHVHPPGPSSSTARASPVPSSVLFIGYPLPLPTCGSPQQALCWSVLTSWCRHLQMGEPMPGPRAGGFCTGRVLFTPQSLLSTCCVPGIVSCGIQPEETAWVPALTEPVLSGAQMTWTEAS